MAMPAKIYINNRECSLLPLVAVPRRRFSDAPVLLLVRIKGSGIVEMKLMTTNLCEKQKQGYFGPQQLATSLWTRKQIHVSNGWMDG